MALQAQPGEEINQLILLILIYKLCRQSFFRGVDLRDEVVKLQGCIHASSEKSIGDEDI